MKQTSLPKSLDAFVEMICNQNNSDISYQKITKNHFYTKEDKKNIRLLKINYDRNKNKLSEKELKEYVTLKIIPKLKIIADIN